MTAMFTMLVGEIDAVPGVGANARLNEWQPVMGAAWALHGRGSERQKLLECAPCPVAESGCSRLR